MGRSSLQFKVVLGYYAISAMALCLSLFTLVELRLVEQRLEIGREAMEFFNNVLEMRRFEKNYLLYGQLFDIDQIEHYASLASQSLEEHPPGPGKESGKIIQLQNALHEYRRLILQQFGQDKPDGDMEKHIRQLGKKVVTAAEEISTEEESQIRLSLERHRTTLIFAVLVVISIVILVGRILSQMVVLPLQRMEESMAGVASGQLSSIHIDSADREILSLTTAFNRVLQELELRQKHLLRSEKLAALGTLLSGVAHELNNPLSNISTSCQILQEVMDEEDQEYKKELIGQIDEQTGRARNIVLSLLDFARDREFRRVPIALNALMGEVIRFSKGTIPPDVQVQVEIPAEITLSGDRQRLQQAFINLIKNAVEAITGPGVVNVRAVAYPPGGHPSGDPLFAANRLPPETAWAEVQVKDSGCGISAEHLSRIFDPFFSTKGVGKGSGLGLTVVFEVLEEHGGGVVVESREGEGTTFRLRLPLHTSSNGENP
ncbi:MAG: hypothetical protein G8345_19610 [Magnetococcales bacterium]|nr:hypothetical protein [Magnetococcales bacterium]